MTCNEEIIEQARAMFHQVKKPKVMYGLPGNCACCDLALMAHEAGPFCFCCEEDGAKMIADHMVSCKYDE